MFRLILATIAVAALATSAVACPPVAVSSYGVQVQSGCFAPAAVAVQSYAVAQPFVAVQAYAAPVVAVQAVKVRAFAAHPRVRVFGRVFGGTRVRVSVR